MGRAPSAKTGAADERKDDHSPELVRLTYLILPPSLSRRRRARIARGAVAEAVPASGIDAIGADLASVRLLLVRRALSVGPGRLPLASRRGGLAALTPSARAAYVLTRLEGMTPEAACALLRSAGVRDPETSLTLAERAGPATADVRAVEVPAATSGRGRFVLAGATAAVLAVTVPILALQGGGGGDVTPIAPVVQTEPTTAGAPASAGKARGSTAEVRKDLDRILRRLTAALAEADAEGPEAARLLNLIAAVQREQQRIRAAEPR